MINFLAFTALLGLTVAVAAVPLWPALRELRQGRDTAPLDIADVDYGDIRSAAERLTHVLSEHPLDTLAHTLVPLVAGIHASRMVLPEAEAGTLLVTQHAALRDLALRGHTTLYSTAPVATLSDSSLPALYATHWARLEAGTRILAWVYGQVLIAGDEVHLSGTADASEAIYLNPGVHFERVRSPKVYIGETSTTPRRLPPPQVKRSRHLIHSDFDVPSGTVLDGDYIVHGSTTLGDGVTVNGSLKSYGPIRTGARCRVTQTLMTEADLTIGPDNTLGGPVLAETHIDAAPGLQVGSPAHLATLSAETITLRPSSLLFGTVWAKHGGKVVTF
ncbi:MAG: hypothetical protein RhofKO_17900 [Rhodothermales bacterium]